jgi:hypothetical protein
MTVKKILENMEIVDLGRRSTGWRKPLTVESVLLRDDDSASYLGFSTRHWYELNVKLSVEFCANEAELKDGTQMAYKTLVRGLHSEALALVNDLQFAVRNNDEEAAIELCNELKKALE